MDGKIVLAEIEYEGGYEVHWGTCMFRFLSIQDFDGWYDSSFLAFGKSRGEWSFDFLYASHLISYYKDKWQEYKWLNDVKEEATRLKTMGPIIPLKKTKKETKPRKNKKKK